jgi:L-ascorbate metabolism protein UlaG (beta-lactamase superfamily)
MREALLQVTYLGGPTALIEVDGLRLLTDPTFDPAGTTYPTNQYTLCKTQGPVLPPEALGRLDAVLLSHDHHFDNLDHAGRALLAHVDMILTTPAGAQRVGDKAIGLVPWQSIDLPTQAGSVVRVTGTPARHGPVDGDRGPVTGFVLTTASLPGAIYLSGDTVWYDGVAEVGHRFTVHVALLFMGAARVVEVGPAALTFTAAEAVDAAHTFAKAIILPLHYEGWAHFTESRQDIARAFAAAGLESRLRWLEPGCPMDIIG